MKLKFYSSIVLLLWWLPSILFGQTNRTPEDTTAQNRPPVQLQEVTIYGTSDQKDVPNSAVAVSPAVIRQTVAADSWDLLRQTAGLEIHEQGQGPGFASDASIRGFSSDHSTDIALWVDGVPVNEPVNGHAEGYNDFSMLFPELIRNIEVIKGPTSSLYGNFALAGTVNIRTLERTDSTTLSLSGGSNGRAEGTLVTGYNNGNSGGVLGIRGTRDDGWRPNSNWQLGQLYGRLSTDLSPTTTIDGGIGLYSSTWRSPGYLTVDQFDRHQYDLGTNSSDGGFKQRAQERVSLRDFISPSLLWRSTVYATQGRWQLFLTIPPEPGSGEGSGKQTDEEDSRYGYGLTSALTWSLSWTDITFGTEGRLDHADYQNWFTTNRNRDSVQTLVSARQLSGATFFSADSRILNFIHTTVGMRYDILGTFSQPYGQPSSSDSKGVFSPKIGLSFPVVSSINLYGNISKGFRQTDGVITDPSLPFITAWNYETGLKFVDESINASVALFQMDVSNEQTFNPVTLSSTSNGASRRRGIDLTFEAQAADAVTVTSTWTITDARYRQLVTTDDISLEGTQIFNTAKYVGTLALELAPLQERWQIRLGSNFVGPYIPFDEPGVTLPPYALFQASGEYRLNNILLELGVRNLFDKSYSELRAGGFVAPGQPRSIYATAHYAI